jgi:hypothetical protein
MCKIFRLLLTLRLISLSSTSNTLKDSGEGFGVGEAATLAFLVIGMESSSGLKSTIGVVVSLVKIENPGPVDSGGLLDECVGVEIESD